MAHTYQPGDQVVLTAPGVLYGHPVGACAEAADPA